MVQRVFAAAGSLRRLRNFLPIKTKVAISQSLVLPLLDYVDISHLDLTEEQLNKLERLQNLCIRDEKARNPPGAETPGPTASTRNCTIMITGTGVLEEVVRRKLVTFEPFTYTQDIDDEKAFVTLESPDAASRALACLDGCEERWRASIRRPPPPGAWATAAPSRPAPPKDNKRNLVTYDDIFE